MTTADRDATSPLPTHDLVPHPDIPVVGPLTGAWSYDLATAEWTWSEEMFALHGFVPGDVVPTTALLLSHQHPDDRAKCRQVMEHAVTVGGHFSCYHRIIDAAQATRRVLTAGSAITVGGGEVVALGGLMVDLTASRRADLQPAIEEALAGALEHRRDIDMAKGAIVLGYGLDPDEAFAILRSLSNATQLKLRDVAQQLVDDLAHTPEDHSAAHRLDAAIARITHRA